MDHNFSIVYKGIKLIPLDADTSEKYRLLRNIPDVGRWFTYKKTISREEQQKWFERYLANPRDVMFAILDENDSFLGCNSIYDIENGSAEYGRLIIDPAYSGKGYGYIATCSAARLAREQMNLKCLKLAVYENNFAAIRSYERAGFVETGVVKDNHGSTMITMELRFNVQEEKNGNSVIQSQF